MTKAVPKKLKQDAGVSFPEELMHLVRKGRTHGFVTYKEILQTYTEPENDLELIDSFLKYLGSIGVEVRDSKPLLEIPPEPDGKKKTVRDDDLTGLSEDSVLNYQL